MFKILCSSRRVTGFKRIQDVKSYASVPVYQLIKVVNPCFLLQFATRGLVRGFLPAQAARYRLPEILDVRPL